MDLRFGDLTPGDLDGVIRVRSQSFGLMPADQRENWLKLATAALNDRRYVGVFDGDRVVAAARIWNFRQWWSGRVLPMGGVAGVVVSPDYRGRGVGSRLMRGVLERQRELGYPLTALYPATLPVYRHLGYEFGGCRYRYSFPAADLRTLGGKDVPLRPGGPDDAERLLELAARVRGANRESGLVGWPVDEVRSWLGEDDSFCYIAEDGFVVYGWEDSDLRVGELVAGSEQTARALWSTVGSGSSIARTVHAYVAPHDPVHLLLGHEADSAAEVQRWMLRLVDAQEAIIGRGWPDGVSVEVPLVVDDPEVTGNDGDWLLRVADGAGELVRHDAGDGALRLTARGLAALYAGTPVATLRVAGTAAGGSPTDDARLAAVFAGPAPYMLDYF